MNLALEDATVSILIEGLPDALVESLVWPLLALELYTIDEFTPLSKIRELVFAVYGLRAQSRRWRFIVDSSLEGFVLKSTFFFAKTYCGEAEVWELYFRKTFLSIADLLSQHWALVIAPDPALLAGPAQLTYVQLEQLVLVLRRARRSWRNHLKDAVQEVFVPPPAHCSPEFLIPRVGYLKGNRGFHYSPNLTEFCLKLSYI